MISRRPRLRFPGPVRRRLTAGGPDDSGQLLLLVLAYLVIAATLVGVAVDVSAVFLARRSLSATADGAVLAAAQTLDEAAIYSGSSGPDDLPLSPAQVDGTVRRYLADDAAATRFPGFAAATATDGVTATVRLAAPVRLPFAGGALRAAGAGGTAQVAVTARARSPFRG